MKNTTIRLSPTVFAKMVHIMNKSENECGYFGIAANPKDPLLITDLAIIKQSVSPVRTSFGDNAIAEFLDEMDKKGVQPFQCNRVWIHHHPGNSCQPSSTDEITFSKVFGSCDFSVMLILARDRSMYCRLQINNGRVNLSQEIPVYIEYGIEFTATNFKLWDEEYDANVSEEITSMKEDYLYNIKDMYIDNNKKTNKVIVEDLFDNKNGEDYWRYVWVDEDVLGDGCSHVHYYDHRTNKEYYYDHNEDEFFDVESLEEFDPEYNPDWMEFIRDNFVEIMNYNNYSAGDEIEINDDGELVTANVHYDI